MYPGMLLTLWLVLRLAIMPLQIALSEIKQLIENTAERDHLTGFWNKAALREALELALSNTPVPTMSVVLIDIDRFKDIIRDYGQAAADVAVNDTAHAISEIVDRRDFVCRFDREEFMLVMLHVDGATAQDKAELIRKRIEVIRDSEYATMRVTASLGVCDIRGLPECTVDTIIEAAQEAVHMAKRGGRNRVYRGDAFLRKYPKPPGIIRL